MGLGNSIQGRKNFGFFQRLLTKFLFFPVGNGQKSPEKSKDFLTRNSTSDSYRFLGVFCRKRWFFFTFSTDSDRFGRPESSTWIALRCTSLVLRLYSTRTPEYWSLAFSPLIVNHPKSPIRICITDIYWKIYWISNACNKYRLLQIQWFSEY
jgi:hypothetical protein